MFRGITCGLLIKGSLRRPSGVRREKAPVTATSGDACFQEKV